MLLRSVTLACLVCMLSARRMQQSGRAQSNVKNHEPEVALTESSSQSLAEVGSKSEAQAGIPRPWKMLTMLLVLLGSQTGDASRFGDDSLIRHPGGIGNGGVHHWSAPPVDPGLQGHPDAKPHPVVLDPKVGPGKKADEHDKPWNDGKKDVKPSKPAKPTKPAKEIEPFTPGRPKIDITPEAKLKLMKGQIWQSSKMDGNVVTSHAVMDVGAMPDIVWSEVLDFDSYPRKIPSLSKAQIYDRQTEGSIEKYSVKFVSSLYGTLDFTYHVKFTHDPAKKSLTWKLDTDRPNDIEDVKGHWHVEPNPKDGSTSRVFYESGVLVPKVDLANYGIPVDLRAMTAFAPQWLKQMVSDKVISGMNSWVKDESEMAVANGAKKLRPLQKSQPFSVDKSMEDVLKDGKVWQKTNIRGNVATGQAVMDVEATPGVIWEQLFDFSQYPEKAPKLSSETQVYKQESHKTARSKEERTLVKFVSPVQLGIKLTNHLDFTYDKSKQSATWKLDSEKKNDLEELQGHWHVERHPDDPKKARVFFEIGVVGPKWIPRWMMEKLMRRALNEATPWVKKEAELIGPQESTWADELGDLYEVLSPYLIQSIVFLALGGVGQGLRAMGATTTTTITSTTTTSGIESDEEDE